MNSKRFVSLNIKMVVAIVLGVILSVCVYFGGMRITEYLINLRYLSDEAVQRTMDILYDDLEEYIEENQVAGTDTEALNKWLEDRRYTYLFLYDDYSNYYSAGWWPSDGDTDLSGELSNDIDLSERHGSGEPQIDEADFNENYADAKNRIVEFSDGAYYAYMDTSLHIRFRRYMVLVCLSLAFLTLLSVLLTYHGSVLKRILHLEGQVRRVSKGNLNYRISSKHNDEVSRLAQDVDDMRLSIIQKHQDEKDAWDANSQLITSMSHDIRTPLTSMIGYLDIIQGGKYQNEEELERYIASCRDKAFQLKDLSDKLFQYFLVFGSKENEKNLEVFDGSVLLTQMIGEHCAEIIGHGYKVNFDLTLPEANLLADISGLRRLFDNVFSNIMKYADKETVVEVHGEAEEAAICIRIVNGIPEQVSRVESTQIGLKTCERICTDLSGSFTFAETDDRFAVTIRLPITDESPQESEENEEESNENME